MIVLVCGGAKSGKSDYAQNLAARLCPRRHYYLATMIPADREDHNRIARHLDSRAGLGFETIEQGRNILSCLERAEPEASFLLDSTTSLLLNELYPDPATWKMDETAPERVAREITRLCRQVRDIVVVSDYIYAEPRRYDPETELYRRGLAHIDRAVARIADTVIEANAGLLTIHKGELP